MADNVDITPGTGKTVATDDVGGIQYQRIKLDAGGDGATVPVLAGVGAAADGLRVALAASSTVAATNAGVFAVQVDGAALTALQLIDDVVIAQGGAIGSTKQALAGGSVTTASPSYTTGQVSPLSLDTAGSLRVAIISGAGSGGTAIADDAAFTVAVTNLTPVGGIYRSVLDSVDDGDAGAFAMTAKRAQFCYLVDVNGDPVSVGGGTQYTQDAALTVATSVGTMAMGRASAAAPTNVSADNDAVMPWYLQSGAQAVNITAAGALIPGDVGNGLDVDVTRLPALVAGTANIGDVDVLTVPADPFGANADAASATGSISAKLRFIASTGIPITGTVTVGAHAVTNAGTFLVQENGAALTSLQLLDDAVATVAAAVPTKGIAAAGTDGTNARLLKTDAAGELQIDILTLPALVAGTANIGDVDVLTLPALVAGTANIGDVDVLTVPTDPFGVNADAASATGSISAKLRFIAATGIPITGTVAVTQSGTWTVQPGNTPNTAPWLVGHGKTLLSKTGSASATFTIVAAVASKKIKVYSLSLMTASTTAVTVTFKDGAAGTVVATYILQAITGTNFGITENVAVPSQLFETTAGVLLEMSFSAAQSVTYNLRYWADDAA